MDKVNCIAFDKTGTLTFGKLTVSNVIPFGSLTEKELLRITASIESRSEHPLGKAIVEYAKENNCDLAEISNFEMLRVKAFAVLSAVKNIFAATKNSCKKTISN